RPVPTAHDFMFSGGGAAGYTAAMFTARDRLRTVVVERFASGGQVLNCEHSANPPASPDGIAGYALGPALQQQANATGAELRMSEVGAVRREGDEIAVETDGEPLRARALIVASGSRFTTLSVPGEAQFVRSAISPCASCDGSFFMNQPVAVVGGGDAAVDEATHLTQYASQVTVVHRRDRLRAAEAVQGRARAHGQVWFALERVGARDRGGGGRAAPRGRGSRHRRARAHGGERRLHLRGAHAQHRVPRGPGAAGGDRADRHRSGDA